MAFYEHIVAHTGTEWFFFPCTTDGVVINPQEFRWFCNDTRTLDTLFQEAVIPCLATFNLIYPLIKAVDEANLVFDDTGLDRTRRQELIDMGTSYAINEPALMKELDRLRTGPCISLPPTIDYLVDMSRNYFRLHEKRALVNKAGYVYLLRSVSGHYKIGRTKNPDARLHRFEVNLPFEVEFEHIIDAQDYVAAEIELHERYDDCRINGEWFDLEPEDVSEIRAIKDM